MEKMQLGSPASPGITGYLPNFLMGVDNHQTPSSFSSPTPSSAFAAMQSPMSVISPISHHQQQQQQPQHHVPNNISASVSGPPTNGLFDNLKNDQSFQTPKRNYMSPQSFSHQIQHDISNTSKPDFMGSPFLRSKQQNIQTHLTAFPSANRQLNSNWVTVFGFPSQSELPAIISHFSQCGSIVEKVGSSGNWIHLKFSSHLECEKALLYNGKIICGKIMIGVVRFNDESKENQPDNTEYVGNIRSLTNASLRCAQEPSQVVLSPNAPSRSTGMFTKTMDLLFGW